MPLSANSNPRPGRPWDTSSRPWSRTPAASPPPRARGPPSPSRSTSPTPDHLIAGQPLATIGHLMDRTTPRSAPRRRNWPWNHCRRAASSRSGARGSASPRRWSNPLRDRRPNEPSRPRCTASVRGRHYTSTAPGAGIGRATPCKVKRDPNATSPNPPSAFPSAALSSPFSLSFSRVSLEFCARLTSCPYKKHCFSLQQAVISFD